MTEIIFPYGKEKIRHSFEDNELIGVLTSSLQDFRPVKSQRELVQEALENPVKSKRLREMEEKWICWWRRDLISEIPDAVVREMHMIPAHTIRDALSAARGLLKQDSVTVTAIPDGVSVIVRKR